MVAFARPALGCAHTVGFTDVFIARDGPPQQLGSDRIYDDHTWLIVKYDELGYYVIGIQHLMFCKILKTVLKHTFIETVTTLLDQVFVNNFLQHT